MMRLLQARNGFCLALATLTLAGCHDGVVTIDGQSGVPLDKVVIGDQAIHSVALLGPDRVVVVHGDKPDIRVSGDPKIADSLRFVLHNGELGIGRKPGETTGDGEATITVTTPAIDQLTMAGSGKITSDRLGGKAAEVTIGGSGEVAVDSIAADKLEVVVAGSGRFTGAGHAQKLALSIAGTGNADMARLNAGDADINIAGTGNGTLASDGHVTGAVIGTGEVTVHGKAHCDVSVTGTGKVTCTP
jgi:hypothetical protein